MRRREFLLLPAAGLVASATMTGQKPVQPASPDLRLWYRQPAANWNEALPIGSGRLAAMVFGAVTFERIQLNEDTIWAGEKRDRSNPEGSRNLAEVRRLLFAGKPKEAEELAEKTIIAVPKRMPPYQPLGDLILNFAGHENVSNYVRELDIDSAIARVSYTSNNRRYTREVFASAVDHVIVVRLTSDKPSSVSFSATLTREQDGKTRTENDRVINRHYLEWRTSGYRYSAAKICRKAEIKTAQGPADNVDLSKREKCAVSGQQRRNDRSDNDRRTRVSNPLRLKPR